MDRALSSHEIELLTWLIENGNAKASPHLGVIPKLRVIAHCACTAASVDFSLDGSIPTEPGMEIVSDYLWTSESGAENGVFAFLKGNQLAGLEVWSCDGEEIPGLPQIDMLRPVEDAEGSNSDA